MNMKLSWCVIVVSVLMLSACGKKTEEASTTTNAPPPSAGLSTPVVPEQPMAPPAAEKAPMESAPAPAAAMAPAPAKMEKPKSSDNVKGGLLSHDEGLALAGKYGCLACHKIETKLIGPSLQDVSKRYKGDAGAKARLITSVKAGSKGNWTEVSGGIPMPPSSPRVPDEDIEKLVSFILSL